MGQVAAAKIVAFAKTQVGKPYSEEGPPGSWFNGQDWHPGLPLPTYYDCDGLAFVSCLAGAGITISNGTAETQWQQHLGGVVPDNEPLEPGDICAFWGANGGPDNAGHTGIVETFDSVTNKGTIVNAYDTQYGICVIPFTRFQPNNGTNGLGWIGAYRPANTVPDPAPPAPPLPAPNKKPPTKQQLEQTNLVKLENVAQAEEAVKNGWALWYFAIDGKFHAQIDGKPTATPLYANKEWKTKNGNGIEE